MCSIEEAWAGQTFEGHKVQSQSDLHRKYMPLADNLLERNNEFSIGHNEPQSREGTRGVNSKFSRESRIPSITNNANPNMQVNYLSTMPTGSNYSGIEPRPSYMSIYDNAENSPMPSMAGKDNFNDINQAYNVSDTVNHFMNREQLDTHKRNSNSSNSKFSNISNNSLLTEDNDIDRVILQKKLNSLNINSENFNNDCNTNNNSNNNNNNNNNNKHITQQSLQFQQALQDIIHRLDRLERDMHHNSTRNMYDMVLYILVGMLIAFIIYSILRK
jgi:hypothetical protein